ncbi:MAG TPA: DUF6176 family protein [Burkholderiales bacterium]
MPEAQCIKCPIKPGQRETLINWIVRLEGRSTEMVEAMAEGGFIAEAVFLERSDSGDHIVIYSSAHDLQAGTKALSNSKLPLVQEFNQLMAKSVDIENAVSLELIFHTP